MTIFLVSQRITYVRRSIVTTLFLWIAGVGTDQLLIYDQNTGVVSRPENHELLNYVENITEYNGDIYLMSKILGVSVYTLDHLPSPLFFL